MSRVKTWMIAVPAAVLALSGCSNEADNRAQEVYEACYRQDDQYDLLQHSGRHVTIEVEGENARLHAQSDGLADRIAYGLDEEDEGLAGFGVTLSILMSATCLTEETGYPGTDSQLRDGDEWDGWRYAEEPGAGSTMTLRFTAIG